MRTWIVLCILLLFVSFMPAQDARMELGEIIGEFSLKFRDSHPDLVFRPNIAVIEFTNESDDAETFKVGEAFTAVAESYLDDSLIFALVDQKGRERAIDEVKFSLSGLTGSGRLTPGLLEEIDLFLSGSITELSGEFVISIRVTDTNTSAVIFDSARAIAKSDVIEVAVAAREDYVSPYGIGVEFAYLPIYYLTGEMADREGQLVSSRMHPASLSFHYRITRSLVAWFDGEFALGDIHLTDSFENQTEIPKLEMQNVPVPGDIDGASVNYYKRRTHRAFSLGFGYVLNVTRALNMTAGFQAGMINNTLIQTYTMTREDSTTTEVASIITSDDAGQFALSPTFKIQYFISPRLSVQTSYRYDFTFDNQIWNQFFLGDTNYSSAGIPLLYGLDPSRAPDGSAHAIDYSGHKVKLGVGLYF